MKKIAFLSLILLIHSYPLSAETIILKSGKTIEASIVGKGNDSIKIDINGIPIHYYFDEIISINGKPLTSENIKALSSKSTGNLPLVIENLGYPPDIALYIAEKLTPLYRKFYFEDINTPTKVKKELEAKADSVFEFIGILKNPPESIDSTVEIYKLLVGPDAFNDLINNLSPSSTFTKTQETTFYSLYACTFHSLLATIILKAHGLDVTMVETDAIDPISKPINQSIGMTHIFCLIRINDQYISYDPLHSFVSDLFTLNTDYRNIKEKTFHLISSKRSDLFKNIVILDDASSLATLYGNIGYLLEMFDQKEKAIFYLRTTLEALPYHKGITKTAMGRIYSDLGNQDTAIKYFEEGVAEIPQFGYENIKEKAYTKLGLIYYRLQRYEKSIINFKKALKINKDNANIYPSLALCYHYLGKGRDFEYTLTKGLKISREQNNEAAYEELKNLDGLR
ncbi:MAG: tetratricopeptide repeat protein [Candidatus Omnitrophica bacterium]|nr:tetratricopeptide repeat protein [Candidatus Omnitrophota bacterium]